MFRIWKASARWYWRRHRTPHIVQTESISDVHIVKLYVHRWHWHTGSVIYRMRNAHVYRSMWKWNDAEAKQRRWRPYPTPFVYLYAKYEAHLISFAIFKEAEVPPFTPIPCNALASNTDYSTSRCTWSERRRSESFDLHSRHPAPNVQKVHGSRWHTNSSQAYCAALSSPHRVAQTEYEYST